MSICSFFCVYGFLLLMFRRFSIREVSRGCSAAAAADWDAAPAVLPAKIGLPQQETINEQSPATDEDSELNAQQPSHDVPVATAHTAWITLRFRSLPLH